MIKLSPGPGREFIGFLAVGSLASPETTLVFDCLTDRRKNSPTMRDIISNLMESEESLKVMCGCQNDILRLKKDYNCFPRLVLDIQDLFIIWRNADINNCFQTCLPALKTLASERG